MLKVGVFKCLNSKLVIYELSSDEKEKLNTTKNFVVTREFNKYWTDNYLNTLEGRVETLSKNIR